MKLTAILLSLALNIALAVLVTQRWVHSHPQNPSNTAIRADAFSTPAPRLDQTWNQLISTNDDTTFVARLRATGFPPSLIRAFAYDQVRARYAGRLRVLETKDAEVPYWRGNPWSYNFNPETRAERRTLERKISEKVKKLLGPEDDASDAARAKRLRNYGSIPQEKITAIRAIQKDYGELSTQVHDGAKGLVLSEDREKLAFLDRERRADIEQLLTPQELDEYDRRNSPAATSTRSQLRYLNPSEDEFLALYQAQRDFDNRYGRDNLTGEQSDGRRAAQPELIAKIETALGPQRFAEYQIVTDGNFSETKEFVEYTDLPVETSHQLISLQRDLIQKAKIVRADKSLTREQQATQLSSLEKEAQEKLSAALGSENSELYKKSESGQWLTKLSAKSKTPTPR